MKKDWRIFAKCRGMDVDMFFPDRGKAASVVAKAKKVCWECPVRRNCLELAIDFSDDHFGVFGGTTSTDRRHIRRLMKKDPNYLSTVDAQMRYRMPRVHQ